jgi:hypothetical protein
MIKFVSNVEPIMYLQRNGRLKIIPERKRVPWRSIHPRTDHATFQPKRSTPPPTNRLLWQFITVTFHLKVDGLSVHPKLWHSNLVDLVGLSQFSKPSHCNILSQSLWHFVHSFSSNFAVSFCPNVTEGPFFQKILHFRSLSHDTQHTDPWVGELLLYLTDQSQG